MSKTELHSMTGTSREMELEAMLVRLLPRAPYRAAFTPSSPVIGFAFDIQAGDHAYASDRIVPFMTRPATGAVTPPGCEVYSTSAHGGEYLTVEVSDPEPLGLDERRMRGSPPRTNLVSPIANESATRLRALLLADRPCALAVTETALGLAEATLEAAYGRAREDRRGGASLTDRRLRRLDNLIEARLGERLTVGQMASAVGLRPRFFLRAFRAATGTTPHAYLLDRRLEAARRDLRTRDARIASIAAATGFASQSHLDTAFRRAFGVTPSAFRQTSARTGP